MSTKRRTTILLAEQSQILALPQKLILEKCGYKVVMADSGETAMGALGQNPGIELILLDIGILDGHGITTETILGKRDVPIVFIAPSDASEIAEKTEGLEPYGLITGDSDGSVLDTSIKMALRLFRANQKTKTLKDKLQATLDALPDIMFEIGLDGRIHDCHSPSTELLYRPAEDLLGKTVHEALPSDTARAMTAAILEANVTGTSSCRQYQLKVPAGTRWFELSVAKKKDSGPDPLFVVLVRDITERKDAIAALSEREELFRSVVQNGSDLTMLSDGKGRVTYLSPQCAEVIGFSPRRFNGKAMTDIIHPEDLAGYSETWARAFQASEEMSEIEYRIIDERDRIRWVAHGARIVRTEGKSICIQSTIRNITDRKLAEEALRKSEQRYRTIVENTGEGIGIVDAKESFVFANKAAEELFGVGPGELEGMNLDRFVMGSQFATIKAETEIRKRGNRSVYELEILQPCGNRKNIIVTAVPLVDGESGFTGTYGIFRDITERKKAEATLAESEQKYRALIDQSLDGIMVSDQNGSVEIWNRAMADITGISPDDAIGTPLCEVQARLIPPEQKTPELLGQLKTGLETILKLRTEWPGKSRIQEIACPDGRRKTVEDSSFLIRTNGKARFGTILRDVTGHCAFAKT